jgi:hypothetical protein
VSSAVISLVVGCLALAFGIRLVVKRRQITERSAQRQREMFGDLGNYLAKSAKPGRTVIIGVGFIVVGSFFFLAGVAGLLVQSS